MAVPGLNKLLTENRARLQSLASKTFRFHGIETAWFTNISYVEEELPTLVDKYLADLVIIGMKGESLAHRLFGSTCTALIGQGKFPVLVVPEGARYKGIASILFACDHHYLSSAHRLLFLKELSREFNARVQLFHVEKASEPILASNISNGRETSVKINLEQVLEEVPHAYRDMEEEDVIKGIERGIADYHTDMLVMVPRKTGFWNTLFHKSNTRKMAFMKERIPLLALPEEKE